MSLCKFNKLPPAILHLLCDAPIDFYLPIVFYSHLYSAVLFIESRLKLRMYGYRISDHFAKEPSMQIRVNL